MSELSPAAQELMQQVVKAQERMLNGCREFFKGLRCHPDPEVSSYGDKALEALEHSNTMIHAMIDATYATKH